MQLVGTKDPATFTETHDEATRIQELTKGKNDNLSSANAIRERNESVNQIKGYSTQNPYYGNYRGRGNGAPQGGPSSHWGHCNSNVNQPKLTGQRDNPYQIENKPTC